MWIFLFPEASKISEWLTAKWPLWDDLIQSPAAFQHLLSSLEAAFDFHTWFWGTERVTHQTRRHLGNGKLHKDMTQKSLDSCFNHVVIIFWWLFFPLSHPRFHLYPESQTATGQQIGRAVVTWCLSARLDSRRAASWHALCSTFMGTWSWENKRGDLCEVRKEAGINKPAHKGRDTKMPAKRYDIHMQNSNKSSCVKTGFFSPQYLLF